VRPNEPIQNFPARGKGIEGADLIGPHEAAIALHISRENCSQTTLGFNGLGHG